MLADLLGQHDLLHGRHAHHNQGPTSTLLLDYKTIDPAKLDALPDDAFLELRHKGALIPVMAMIASGQNGQKLAVRAEGIARNG